MKKNNKGFFMVETIIVLTLVTSVLAFVYPSLSSIYETFINQVKYYDQTEDLYALRAIYEANKTYIDSLTKTDPSKDDTKGCNKNLNINNSAAEITGFNKLVYGDDKDTDIAKLFITNYMDDSTYSGGDVDFASYLNQLKKTSYDGDSYRLIGIFETDSEKRYASIKIYNPNTNGFCGS